MFNGAVCVTVITRWMVQEKAIKIFLGHNDIILNKCRNIWPQEMKRGKRRKKKREKERKSTCVYYLQRDNVKKRSKNQPPAPRPASPPPPPSPFASFISPFAWTSDFSTSLYGPAFLDPNPTNLIGPRTQNSPNRKKRSELYFTEVTLLNFTLKLKSSLFLSRK